MAGFLRVSETRIVDDEGKEVILRGAGLGGWMTMENFISGYPGCEFQIREVLAEVIGQEKSEYFFDKFLEHFFAEPDAAFFKSLGLNCIRIAINYRHFEDDLNPRVLKESGFKHLDRVVAACAKHGIYTILDMHTAPGGQNGGLVWLWTEIAKHYKDETWIAGYNPMNEPADPRHNGLVNFYDRVDAAVRSVDPYHILFLDGNTYSTDFSGFPDDAGARWSNTAYAIHDYSVYGFPDTPEPYARTEEQRTRMQKSYTKKRAWMDERGLCVWNGEWGPVYARPEYEGDATDEINERRYNVLNDQLQLYAKASVLCTDVKATLTGMVYVSPETAYRQHFAAFLGHKYRLAADSWGADDKYVRHAYDPIVRLIEENVPNEEHRKLYPYPVWTVRGRVARVARCTLISEFLVREWADQFAGLSVEQLDRLAESFKFENCMERDGLNKVLREHASQAG
ncbi:hypothetical protein GSI_03062 [Ganoderma sinense ZZ0214-1]|uniref:Glycoside hydrolase family 5 domain-containing protein n=1 Tax=Ganoderma sinense ZZ0214-1 TaxID=1077348 RepID=A0A2G8SKL5_9APHY|nr:hypothetical protein GSI_03062 [Ganoderma sinense ZZ0214-1]